MSRPQGLARKIACPTRSRPGTGACDDQRKMSSSNLAIQSEIDPAPTSDSAPVPARPTMIRVTGLHKRYQRGSEQLEVLKGLELEVKRGRFEALMGPSGSGKTTLLNIIGGLDQPSEGSVVVDGQEIAALSDADRARFRAQRVGFVFQAFNLIPVLTAAENVELPLLLTALPRVERRQRALTALKLVGLSERSGHLPRQLSGGQEQRVAIARAIVTDPALIVADEPTGDLDRESADAVLDLLVKLSRDFDKTVLMVTHDPAAAARADLVRRMDKGVFA